MRIKTYDQEYTVTDERGQKIAQAVLSDDPPLFVDLNGDVIRATSIMRFRAGGIRPEDRPAIEEASKKRLFPPNDKFLD